jgi:hypothetical protein
LAKEISEKTLRLTVLIPQSRVGVRNSPSDRFISAITFGNGSMFHIENKNRMLRRKHPV